MHSSQMKTDGPAINFLTSCWLLPQKEQYKIFLVGGAFFLGHGARCLKTQKGRMIAIEKAALPFGDNAAVVPMSSLRTLVKHLIHQAVVLGLQRPRK